MRRNRTSSITLHSKGQQQLQQRHRDAEIAAVWRPTNLRVRAVSRLRRAGPSTPAPSWRLYENPFYDDVMQIGATQQVSARKLAASLWELTRDSSNLRLQQESNSADDSRPGAARKKLLLLPSPPSTSRKRDQAAKPTDGNAKAAHKSRQLVAMQAHICRLLDKPSSQKQSEIEVVDKQPTEKAQNNSENHTQKQTKRTSIEIDTEKQPTESNNTQLDTEKRIVVDKQSTVEKSTISTQLVQRIDSLEQEKTSSSTTSLTTAMKAELRRARHSVEELEAANRLSRKEIDSLLKKIADDKATSMDKEQIRVKQALQTMKEEIEQERKLKRKMELAHRKLTRELGEAKVALSKAVEERDKERKARALMEDVCDELAKEIGQDKAEVEQLKGERVKLKEEIEEERRMLQVAEVWREERVHMKLEEARQEMDRKADSLEVLKTKLQEFLKRRRRVLDNGDYASQQADIRLAEKLDLAAESLVLACKRLGGDEPAASLLNGHAATATCSPE